MSVVLFVFISVILIMCFVYKRKNKHSEELFAKLPGPTSWPIVGNIWCILDPSERVNHLRKWLLENNGVLAIHGFWLKYVIVSDLEVVKKLCTSNYVKKYGKSYKLFESWIGTNVFNSDGLLWKKYRSVLTPIFHLENVEQYIPIITCTSRKLIEDTRSSIGKQINVYEYVELWSINTFLGITVKLTFAAGENLDSQYVQNVRDITQIIARRITDPFKYYDFLFRFTRDYWDQKRIVGFIRNETKELMKQTVVTEVESGKKSSRKARTFLDIMQDKRDTDLNEKEICDHLQGLLFAGYETTASAISFVLYSLSIHQDVQEKAFQEIQSIYGKDKTKVCTTNDLQKMSYLEMVIKESMRLYPPVPAVSKYILEEFQLGDYIIPRDTEVIIAILALHRTPKYFPNPDVFDPERFAPENIGNIKPFSYIPFSAGSRNCIAQKIAMLAMKIAISMVLRNYKLLPADEFQLKLFHHLTLKPGDEGVQVKLQSRDE